MLKTTKNRVLNITIKFIVFIGLCTLLSRGMVSMSIPIVKVEKVQSAVITNKLQASGTVEGSQDRSIGTEPGLIVSRIAVSPGEQIKKGEILYTVDPVKLEELIKTKEQELYIMDLQIQDLVNVKEQQQQERDIAYQQAVEAYESAIQSGDETSILQAGNALEIAGIQQVSDSSIEQNTISRSQKAEELERYQELQMNEGNIVTPVDGTITSIKIEPGGMTSNGADILLAETNTNCKLTVQFDEENMQYLEAGQPINAIANTKEKIDGVNIHAITREKDKVNVVMMFPKDTVSVGDNVEIEILLKSAEYECCVSRSAIYQSNKDEYYVNALKEVDTILGTQLEIQQIYVDIIDKDSNNVAVEGISSKQEIVIDSTKEISDGSRVRQQEI